MNEKIDGSRFDFEDAKSMFQLATLLLEAGKIIERSEGLVVPKERLGRVDYVFDR